MPVQRLLGRILAIVLLMCPSLADADVTGTVAFDGVEPLSAAQQHTMPRDVLGNGGMRQVGADYALHGTIGQAAIGRMAGSHLHGAGFWMPLGQASSGIEENELDLPTSFALSTAFPHPVRSAGILRFAVPRRSPVSIELYDVSGRRIRTLVDGSYDAGIHEVELSSEALASGIYFCRMTAHRFKQTRRLVLLR
jgi:hypothetical protein